MSSTSSFSPDSDALRKSRMSVAWRMNVHTKVIYPKVLYILSMFRDRIQYSVVRRVHQFDPQKE